MNVTINGFTWRIVFTRSPKALMREDGVITLGVTDRRVFCIYIYAGLKGGMLRKVLMHEICHAHLFSYGYRFSEEIEEQICMFVDTFGENIVGMAENVLAEERMREI